MSRPPDNCSIQCLQKELYSNTHAIHSSHGSGMAGHLAEIMASTDCLAHTNIPFSMPAHPSKASMHAATTTIIVQITKTTINSITNNPLSTTYIL